MSHSLPATTEEEMAQILDGVLDDLRAGRSVDREALVARYPQLAEPLDGLLQMGVGERKPATHPAPAQVGHYHVRRELGVGGFGIVYAAHDPGLKREVALKLLHPGRLTDPEALARFEREACLTAKLAHPGIVRLLDYSRTGPPHYLVTELIDGIDPCRWSRETNADLHAIIDLVARIAEAVEHAHANDICHRDLKPGNILIDAHGSPHVLDFGLARLLSVEESQAPTADGCILGSLAYMAPEQAAGESHHADARSDVYSLGVILFELMTGRLPFEGPAHSLPVRVMEEDPAAPRDLKPSIPRGLEAICLKAMAKRPDHRYPTAGGLARDLRAWLAGEAVEAREYGWFSKLTRILGRRHRDTMTRGWTRLLVLIGLTILIGCVIANYWELTRPVGSRWPFVLGTKLAQVGVMILLVMRLRPLQTPHLTPAERQIWTLVPAYYGSMAALVLVNLFLDEKIPLAPVLAILSGMGFISLASTIWGWFYLWGIGFYLLAVLIAFHLDYGLTLLGVGWFIALGTGAVILKATR